MEFKSLKIGKYTIEKPIVQGGMGVGISWDQLAGNVSKEGGLGVISAVGTGVYKNKTMLKKLLVKKKTSDAINFYSKEALVKIFKNARKICGDKPLAANVLYAQMIMIVLLQMLVKRVQISLLQVQDFQLICLNLLKIILM